MLLIIEHSGTKDSNKLARDLSNLLESEFGATTEHIVGDITTPIIIYTEDLKPIFTCKSLPDIDILRYILNLNEDKL